MGKKIHCLTYLLLIIPPFLLTSYFFAAFPNRPESIQVSPSLASLPKQAKSWSVYPEDFYGVGGYARFPYGKVKYWMLGPEDGKKIVLIHGLSIPALIWKDVAPGLAARGYRVLLYDLYGRGYSDAPQTTYDTTLYVTQLALLMQHIKWEKAHVFGVSMGGALTAAFTANFPELVEDRVVVVASAGLIKTSDLSRTTKVMSSPLVQTLTSSWLARKFIQRLTDSANETSDKPVDPIQEIVRLQSAHLSGYNAAISSSLRDGPVRGEEDSFKSDVWKGRRLLIIHGTKDNTVPYKYAAQIQSLVNASGCDAQLVTIEGAGHDLTVSHPDEIVQNMTKFLSDS
ncbi:hypothetical protein D9758_011185 [Tetrapyrgos nigripes]|uniref:AB hydrolase-1 domain-containing protein n=1 Tax=Tetrapyrgos nigripes TaxID=182062 RepID=A0A8H5FZ49_9AGAR|nr:hypothetical protein D9758_011185 [Tetrapyrgos nigripes]